ncbi:MAG: hypothetical protein RIR00_101, partial [Pseudomonadota bacterium]
MVASGADRPRRRLLGGFGAFAALEGAASLGLSPLAAAAPAKPADAAIGIAGARHLLSRTGFGAPPAWISQFAPLSRAEAVARLLDASPAPPSAPPHLDYQRPAALRDLQDAAAIAEFQREQRRQGVALRGWWLGQMLHAANPATALQERMVLFWHNHFVSSQQKVKALPLMLRQNQLFRQYALGNFASLLHAVARDPAMVVYLDSASNRRESPNENFARELLELFTLGQGHYREQDIKEVARAFTGWSFEPASGEFRFRPFQHDDGEKQIFGQRGQFDGDGVLDLLLAEPATAEFLVGKFWREFVAPEISAATRRRLAAEWRQRRYDLRALLRALLLQPEFWAASGSLIKSPLDFVIGTLRSLDIPVSEPLPLTLLLRQLGQDVFAPPNVRGWPGGESWIDASTLLLRKQFIERLLRGG